MEDDIIEIKPGFAGVAINVRAAWRRVSKQGRVDRGPTVAERFLGLFDDDGVARGRIPNLVEGLSYRAVESPDALLAACDLAVAPAETEPGAGRFIADALRSGVPVEARRHAPGAALLAPGAGMRSPGARASGTGRAGVFVDSDTPDAWLRALTTALDERWLREARAHAARAAESLAMDALAARIEALLVHPRSTAPAPAGPATRPGSAGPSPTRAASDQKPSQAPRR